MISLKTWLRVGLLLAIAAQGMSQTSVATPTVSLSDAQPFFGGALLTSSKMLIVGGTSSLPRSPWNLAGTYLLGGAEVQKLTSSGHGLNNEVPLALKPHLSSAGAGTRRAVVRVGASSLMGAAVTRALTTQYALHRPNRMQGGLGTHQR